MKMETVKISVLGKDYSVRFDYMALRKFANEIGLNKPSDIGTLFEKMDLNEPSFKDIDNIAILLRSAIKDKKIPTFDQVLEEISENPESFAKVITSFGDSTTVDTTEEGESEKN